VLPFAQVADSHGHSHLLQLLTSGLSGEDELGAPEAAEAGSKPARPPTLLVAPKACYEHRTFPEPLVRLTE
jgi:hypothetical protein